MKTGSVKTANAKQRHSESLKSCGSPPVALESEEFCKSEADPRPTSILRNFQKPQGNDEKNIDFEKPQGCDENFVDFEKPQGKTVSPKHMKYPQSTGMQQRSPSATQWDYEAMGITTHSLRVGNPFLLSNNGFTCHCEECQTLRDIRHRAKRIRQYLKKRRSNLVAPNMRDL